MAANMDEIDNEYICYNVSQIRLRYLLRVRM